MSGRYHSYSQYQHSGVGWLGDIPSGWSVARVKQYCDVTDGSHHSPAIQASGYPFISVTEVRRDDIDFEECKRISTVDYQRLVREGCKPERGNLLLTKDGTIGRAVVVRALDPPFVILSSLGLLSRFRGIDSEFLRYYLISGICVDQMNSMIHGSALRRLTIKKINELVLTFPELAEQTQIARFLDYETAKIDALIAKQQELIALFKEKRQAVISHAVTKGLNPAAPMRDSGVEWLGEVPAHWEVVKLYHLTSRIGDGLHGTPSYQDGTGLFFVNGNNLEDGRIVIGDSAKEVSSIEYERHHIPMSHSTVLLSINGTIGKVAIYADEKVILGKSAAYINCLDKLAPRFLQVFFQSHNASRYYNLVSTGTTISNLSLDSIRQLRIGLPDLGEQEVIIKYCAKQSEKYDELITVAFSMVDKLQERRTALISAAVTGKIDVRGWQAPESKIETETEVA